MALILKTNPVERSRLFAGGKKKGSETHDMIGARGAELKRNPVERSRFFAGGKKKGSETL